MKYILNQTSYWLYKASVNGMKLDNKAIKKRWSKSDNHNQIIKIKYLTIRKLKKLQ